MANFKIEALADQGGKGVRGAQQIALGDPGFLADQDFGELGGHRVVLLGMFDDHHLAVARHVVGINDHAAVHGPDFPFAVNANGNAMGKGRGIDFVSGAGLHKRADDAALDGRRQLALAAGKGADNPLPFLIGHTLQRVGQFALGPVHLLDGPLVETTLGLYLVQELLLPVRCQLQLVLLLAGLDDQLRQFVLFPGQGLFGPLNLLHAFPEAEQMLPVVGDQRTEGLVAAHQFTHARTGKEGVEEPRFSHEIGGAHPFHQVLLELPVLPGQPGQFLGPGLDKRLFFILPGLQILQLPALFVHGHVEALQLGQQAMLSAGVFLQPLFLGLDGFLELPDADTGLFFAEGLRGFGRPGIASSGLRRFGLRRQGKQREQGAEQKKPSRHHR